MRAGMAKRVHAEMRRRRRRMGMLACEGDCDVQSLVAHTPSVQSGMAACGEGRGGGEAAGANCRSSNCETVMHGERQDDTCQYTSS